jgi:hypothetical protein
MKKFHICYMKSDTLCTGTNVESSSYEGAITDFNKLMPDAKIVYVTELDMLIGSIQYQHKLT